MTRGKGKWWAFLFSFNTIFEINYIHNVKFIYLANKILLFSMFKWCGNRCDFLLASFLTCSWNICTISTANAIELNWETWFFNRAWFAHLMFWIDLLHDWECLLDIITCMFYFIFFICCYLCFTFIFLFCSTLVMWSINVFSRIYFIPHFYYFFSILKLWCKLKTFIFHFVIEHVKIFHCLPMFHLNIDHSKACAIAAKFSK